METTTPAEAVVRGWLALALKRVIDAEQELGRLDAAAGDGDHGATMVRGLRSAEALVGVSAGNAGELLVAAGAAFSDAAGGASGALVGALLSTVGSTLGDGPYEFPTVAAALNAGLSMVMRLGKAQPGDKTLVDALYPFVDALAAQPAGRSLARAWCESLPAAQNGAARTRDMIARRGRSARLAERSVGHIDPGAASLVLLLEAAGESLAVECSSPVTIQDGGPGKL